MRSEKTTSAIESVAPMAPSMGDTEPPLEGAAAAVCGGGGEHEDVKDVVAAGGEDKFSGEHAAGEGQEDEFAEDDHTNGEGVGRVSGMRGPGAKFFIIFWGEWPSTSNSNFASSVFAADSGTKLCCAGVVSAAGFASPVASSASSGSGASH